jgi:hypothetical protein
MISCPGVMVRVFHLVDEPLQQMVPSMIKKVQAMYAYRDRALSVVPKAGGPSQVLYG